MYHVLMPGFFSNSWSTSESRTFNDALLVPSVVRNVGVLKFLQFREQKKTYVSYPASTETNSSLWFCFWIKLRNRQWLEQLYYLGTNCLATNLEVFIELLLINAIELVASTPYWSLDFEKNSWCCMLLKLQNTLLITLIVYQTFPHWRFRIPPMGSLSLDLGAIPRNPSFIIS